MKEPAERAAEDHHSSDLWGGDLKFLIKFSLEPVRKVPKEGVDRRIT